MSGYSQWKLLAHVDNVASGAAASMTTQGFDPALLLKIYLRIAGYSASSVARLRFNGDSGANYAYKVSENLAAATAATGASGLDLATALGGSQALIEMTLINSVTIEKSLFWDGVAGSLVAATAPNRIIGSGIWINAAAINQVTLDAGSGGGTLSLGTGISVFGSEAT
jgi:hypothetical protein